MKAKSMLLKTLKYAAVIFLIAVAAYGTSRLYYLITDGFTIGNISSSFSHDARWDIPALNADQQAQLDSVLSQPFTYLGKGCQAYVFLSQDGRYVLKFFKYQRFRPQEWLDYFSFIPAVDSYRLGKIEKKKKKLDGVFNSWKLVYEHLQPETQIVYVHLNKTNHLNKTLVIYDKIGFKHSLEADQMEFMLQRKADMLCPYLDNKMKKGDKAAAERLLTRIIALIVSEYKRGYADNDHALMQNTGVYNDYPIHIDVGQFVIHENAQKQEIYKQELFNKTFKFRKWLRKNHPSLLDKFEMQLREIIGDQFDSLEPHFKPHE